MCVRYSWEELLSINRQAPPAIPYNIYARLRTSGLCIHRPTKRSKKRKHHRPRHQANLCLLNARSILNKCEVLQELLTDVQPDVVAITET